jgi:hypothetical protein
MHRDVLVPRSTGTCESGLARERGGEIVMPCSSASGLLQAKTVCTEPPGRPL